MAKIIILHGSPRRYGAVTKLASIAAKGVEDAGGEPEIIRLYDYKIKECLGCVSDDTKYCRFPCIINDDDFNKIGKKILEADGFILVTPVYWYSMSGVMKNFIDRLTSMENMIFITGRSLLEGKVAGFIASGNDSGTIMALAHMMIVLNSMGVHIPGWAIAYHHSMDDVTEDDQALLDSYNVGYNVAKLADIVKNTGAWYKPDVDMKKLVEIANKEAEKHLSQQEERKKLFEKLLRETKA